MEKPKFEFLEHTADIKFRAYALTLDKLFENCALAVTAYLLHGKKPKPKTGKVINVRGNDIQSLLYNFIEEILFLLETENFIISKLEVQMMGNNLRAELFGDKAKDYEMKEIKAPTYAEMLIKKVNSGWMAQMVLDV